MSEIPGQLALFEVPYEVMIYSDESSWKVTRYSVTETWRDTEPLCDECGTACTNWKQCVEISGKYDEEETLP